MGKKIEEIQKALKSYEPDIETYPDDYFAFITCKESYNSIMILRQKSLRGIFLDMNVILPQPIESEAVDLLEKADCTVTVSPDLTLQTVLPLMKKGHGLSKKRGFENEQLRKL